MEMPQDGQGGDNPHERCSDFPHRALQEPRTSLYPAPRPAHRRTFSSCSPPPQALHLSCRVRAPDLLSTGENPTPHFLEPATRCSQLPLPLALPTAAMSSVRPQSPAPRHACTHLLQPVRAGTAGLCCKPPVWWLSQSKGGRRRAGGPS